MSLALSRQLHCHENGEFPRQGRVGFARGVFLPTLERPPRSRQLVLEPRLKVHKAIESVGAARRPATSLVKVMEVRNQEVVNVVVGSGRTFVLFVGVLGVTVQLSR